MSLLLIRLIRILKRHHHPLYINQFKQLDESNKRALETNMKNVPTKRI